MKNFIRGSIKVSRKQNTIFLRFTDKCKILCLSLLYNCLIIESIVYFYRKKSKQTLSKIKKSSFGNCSS